MENHEVHRKAYLIDVTEMIEIKFDDWGANVAGYFTSEKGVGEGVRATIRAIEQVKIPYALINVLDSGSENTDQTHSSFVVENPFRFNIFQVNADQAFVVSKILSSYYFTGHYNIGYWAWEQSTFCQWRSSFRLFDEIWVPSSFALDSISRIAPIPVVRIPHSIEPTRAANKKSRSRFHVSRHAFMFLFMFDFHSFFERKNPAAVIRAFKMAFGDDSSVALVVKCMHSAANQSELHALKQIVRGGNVQIVDQLLSRDQTRDLIAATDCYVSLHRAEGFGLSIAEAMSMAKPVIVTGYSGNMDFTNCSNSLLVKYRLVELSKTVGPYTKGTIWAEPDVEHAASMMRLVYEDRKMSRALGLRAQRDISRLLSPRVVGNLIEDRFRLIIDAP